MKTRHLARRKRRDRSQPLLAIAACLAGLALAGCSEKSQLAVHADVGPQPQLVEPKSNLLPTVNVAEASSWPSGAMPTPAPTLQVAPFAIGLDHPRWLLVLSNGDVLVAETNAPPRPADGRGVKGWVMKKLMAKAGAGTPSANRITLLRDADGDGRAELQTVLLQGAKSPFGMAQVGDHLYVANTDAVMSFPYTTGSTRIASTGQLLTELPGGTLNHHWTKALIASPDGSKLYATVGSNSNVAENGIEREEGRAAIWEIDRATGSKRLYATGLRNPNGMAWIPTGAAAAPVLWTVVNERDELGSDLVPDYLTSVRDGAFYGWPYSWYGRHVDARVKPPRDDLVARAVVPDYALGSHVAPLGLAASVGSPVANNLTSRRAQAPAAAASAPAGAERTGDASGAVQGVFIGEHGSWNRRPLSGYKVVFVPFAGGRPSGLPIDVLTDFVDAEGRARGRPVGVAMDSRGALLVADDVGNTVWRVTAR